MGSMEQGWVPYKKGFVKRIEQEVRERSMGEERESHIFGFGFWIPFGSYQAATTSQFFISYTIRTFGALVFATIMTTRQVGTKERMMMMFVGVCCCLFIFLFFLVGFLLNYRWVSLFFPNQSSSSFLTLF